MAEPEESGAGQAADLRGLRMLRRLVTALTLVMIVGMVVVATLLALRLGAPPRPPLLPDTLALPEGTEIRAVTRGEGWWAVVTGQGEILIFDAAGRLAQRVAPEAGG
jgi:hypothetical protein